MRLALIAAACAGLVFTAVGPVVAAPARLETKVVKAGAKDGGGEPSLAIAKDDTMYVSYPGDAMEMSVSRDRGKSWSVATSPEKPSGDTSVNVDTTGAVYETNLNGIETNANSLQVDLFKSYDQGKTWPIHSQSALESGNSSGQPFLVDRQWVDAAIPPHMTSGDAIVAMEYHDWGPGAVWVEVSKDGGHAFGVPVDVMTSPQAAAAGICDTIPGGVKIVPYGTNAAGVAYKHPGRIYAAWLAADAASDVATGCNETQLAAFHSVWVAYSDDGGQTWTDSLVYDAGPLHDGSEIFADLTLDNVGNPYVAFSMNILPEFDAWVTDSMDGGTTWISPVQVNADKGTHYFPAVAAGDPGQVFVGWIATPDVVPTTPYGKPQPAADANSDWFAYAGLTQNLNAAHPSWSRTQVTPTSIHHGDVCTLGIFCIAVPNSDRDLLDFIDAQIDNHGHGHVVFTGDYGSWNGIYAANQESGPSLGSPGH